jgi:hypothetical protein
VHAQIDVITWSGVDTDACGSFNKHGCVANVVFIWRACDILAILMSACAECLVPAWFLATSFLRDGFEEPALFAGDCTLQVQAALTEVSQSPWKIVKYLFNKDVMAALKVKSIHLMIGRIIASHLNSFIRHWCCIALQLSPCIAIYD